MKAWELVNVPSATVQRSRGLTISVTAQSSKTKGYLYFSAGIGMKEGNYNMVSKDGVFGFVADTNGKYLAKKKETCGSAIVSDRSLLAFLRDKLKLDKTKCYKYTARIEDGVIVLDPSKLIYD